MSRKLTDEDIQGAMDRHPEYRLQPGVTWSATKRTCCPVGICAMDNGVIINAMNTLEVIMYEMQLDRTHTEGIVRGFDTETTELCYSKKHEYHEGFALGQRWRAKALEARS